MSKLENSVAPRATMNGKPVYEVPAKTVINFESGFGKKLLCDGPVFNAGQACVYSCDFCYVEAMELKQRDWFKKHGVQYGERGHFGNVVRNANAVERARQQLLAHPEADRQQKKVIYSSTKVDVAGNMELVRETVEICKVILDHTSWDVRLLSKSNLLPKVALGLLDKGNSVRERVIFGVSTGTIDDKLAAAFEQGTPKVSKRIESLHWLQDNGFRTFGMICPSLPQWLPGHSTELAYFEWASQVAAAIRPDQCEHVWAEVINLRGASFTATVAALQTAGYGALADELARVSHDKEEWERYARQTFTAHAQIYPPGKLRFLQYVTKATRGWWEDRRDQGAVLL